VDVKDFRPLSLVGAIIKIIFKVLVKRLKQCWRRSYQIHIIHLFKVDKFWIRF